VALAAFVGRGRDLAEVRGLLGRARLVTPAGPGGAGKTRLARELASLAAAGAAFPDGVWWVELAALPPGADPAPALAAALGVRQPPAADHPAALTDALAAAVAGRRLLVVLDNCEHVVDGAGRAGRRAPPPLPRPHPAGHQPRGARRRGRGRVARGGARPPHRAGARGPPPRSDDGGPRRRRARRRRARRRRGGRGVRPLSVFRSGFTLDAAVQVCAGGRVEGATDGGGVLEALGRLVEQSLVQVRDDGGEVRYTLLEPVRQYGAALLAGTSDEAPTRDRHLGWAAALVADAEPRLVTRARWAEIERLGDGRRRRAAAATSGRWRRPWRSRRSCARTRPTGAGPAAAHADAAASAEAGSPDAAAADAGAAHAGEAAAVLEALVAAEPLREAAHRALMVTYVAAGEPARALAHYDALATLLARELGAAPAPETATLAASVRRRGVAPSAAP
jgi:hypothetical protein